MNTLDTNLLSEVARLMYYDGPLLSAYSTPDGSLYMGMWGNGDEFCDEFYFAEINSEILTSYKDGKITLRKIMENSKAIYFGVNGAYYLDVTELAKKVEWSDIPEVRRPGEDSWFEGFPK